MARRARRRPSRSARCSAKNARLFALVTNTLAKDKEIEDRWRGFKRPISSRNLANFVEDEVVDALIAAVRASFPRCRTAITGSRRNGSASTAMPYWDRNAPLPEEDDRLVPWPEAQRIVLDAYGAFSPDMAAVGQALLRPSLDRRAGAAGQGARAPSPIRPCRARIPICCSTIWASTRDVMTLAHELGHGVHQVLAGPQGALMSDTPLTLAETASVFGEMLTFQALLKAETDPKRRKAMLAGKVEDMLNTVVRQIAFVEFERRLHDERRQGELTAERIGEIWMEVQKRKPRAGHPLRGRVPLVLDLYPAFHPHAVLRLRLCLRRLPGELALCGLSGRGKGLRREISRHAASAGGTKRHKELLAPFGLDASDPEFWNKGLSVIAGLIDQLEAMG